MYSGEKCLLSFVVVCKRMFLKIASLRPDLSGALFAGIAIGKNFQCLLHFLRNDRKKAGTEDGKWRPKKKIQQMSNSRKIKILP